MLLVISAKAMMLTEMAKAWSIMLFCTLVLSSLYPDMGWLWMIDCWRSRATKSLNLSKISLKWGICARMLAFVVTIKF